MAGRNKDKRPIGPEDIAAAFAKPMGKGPSTRQKRETISQVLPTIRAETKANIELARKETRGRKSTYTRERFKAVCDLMGQGLPAHEAQRELGIPSSTFTDWLNQSGEEGLFCRETYARARQALADWAFSEALSVPQRLLALAMTPQAPDGDGKPAKPLVDSAMVGAARLVTDSLKWYAERLNPGQYAEAKAPPPTVTVNNNSLTISGRDLDPDKREQLRALLLAARDNGGNLPSHDNGDN
jgi:hypothetical protein